MYIAVTLSLLGLFENKLQGNMDFIFPNLFCVYHLTNFSAVYNPINPI